MPSAICRLHRCNASRTLSTVAVAVIVCALAALIPASARAADQYQQTQLTDAVGHSYACPEWSGGADENGNSYLACGNHIDVIDEHGVLRHVAYLPKFNGQQLMSERDVAPNADGSVLYVVAGEAEVDQPSAKQPSWSGWLFKMLRQPDGSYAIDPSFHANTADPDYQCWGQTAGEVGPIVLGCHGGSATNWLVRNVALDDAGDVFVTTNAYVVVFDPNGNVKAFFGGDGQTPYAGGLEIAEGIAVSPDGQHIYVDEQRHNNIERYDLGANGEWTRASWHLGNYDQTDQTDTNCASTPAGFKIPNGAFASPYDIGLDAHGHIFVMDTTCRRLLEYNTADASIVQVLWSQYPNGPKRHGIVVDSRGDVIIPESGMRFANLSEPYGSCATPPTITAIATNPASTSTSVPLNLTVSAPCSTPTTMTISGDVTNPGTVAFATSSTVQLTAGAATKHITVSVTDIAGHTSAPATTSVAYTLPPVTQPAPTPPADDNPPASNAPVTGGGPAPSKTVPMLPQTGTDAQQPAPANENAAKTTQPPKTTKTNPKKLRARRFARVASARHACAPHPMQSLGNAKHFHITENCVRLSGKVVAIRKITGGRMMTIELSKRLSRAIYRNAVAPVNIDVVASSTLSPLSTIRVGHRAWVIGTVIANHANNYAVIAPAARWWGPKTSKKARVRAHRIAKAQAAQIAKLWRAQARAVRARHRVERQRHRRRDHR